MFCCNKESELRYHYCDICGRSSLITKELWEILRDDNKTLELYKKIFDRYLTKP